MIRFNPFAAMSADRREPAIRAKRNVVRRTVGSPVMRGAAAVAGGGVMLAKVPVLPYLIGGIAVLVVVGVALPAVFLRSPSQRRDALDVLRLILDCFGPRRPS